MPMGKPMMFAIVSACFVIIVSFFAIFSFSENIPREYQVARISELLPCADKDGVLPALHNPNFPPPPLVPLMPEEDPLDVDDLPPAGGPELTPSTGGILENIWGWYQAWLESLKIKVVPETVIRQRGR